MKRGGAQIQAKKDLVRELMLTDMAIWTEARYTRHPSQAELFAPFQDFPSSIEHFPAGSIIAPRKRGGPTKIEFKNAPGKRRESGSWTGTGDVPRPRANARTGRNVEGVIDGYDKNPSDRGHKGRDNT